MNRTIFGGLAVLALAGSGAALALGSSTEDRPAAAATNQTKASFAIENMTCAMCPITVKKAIEGVSGVSAVEIDFEAKTARVAFDPRQTNESEIAAASTNAGYPAKVTSGS